MPINVYGVKMKDIKECAEFYKSFLNKDYIFTLEGDIKFKIFFVKGNFHHLLGLGKLKDIEELNIEKNKADKIYKDILSGDISIEKIENSVFYYKILNRVENFQNITDLLDIDKCKIIIDFDRNLLDDTNLINTKYILFKHKNDGYIHLTLGDKGKGIYPETFFYEGSKRYITEQVLLDIIDIEIVTHAKKKKELITSA